MAIWNTNPPWTSLEDLNRGQQFTARDGVSFADFNAIIHNMLWLRRNNSSAATSAELVTIEVPAANAADKGKWIESADGGYYRENTFTDASASSAVLQSCTNVKAFTENGLRLEYNYDWEIRIDSLPATACTMFLLFIPHDVEDEPCIFPPLGTGSGNGVTGKYYTVLVPAADASDLHGWYFNQSSELYELQIMNVEWMKESLFIELKSENAALFTEHNIVLYQDDGYLDFSIDSLPERESTLYIVVPNYADSGLLNGGES